MTEFSFFRLTFPVITSYHQSEDVEEFCGNIVAHVRDCVLCEWLWEMSVCWMASVVLGPCAHSDRSLLEILGPLVSLSAVCHAGWLFHLLTESSGVKSLSKNWLPLMAMWHMKWLLLLASLCVRQSVSSDPAFLWLSDSCGVQERLPPSNLVCSALRIDPALQLCMNIHSFPWKDDASISNIMQLSEIL